MGLAEISPDRIEAHVRRLAGFGPRCPENPSGLIDSLAYIASCLEEYGYRVLQEHYGPKEGEVNLIAESPALERAGGAVPIELGAHYDTVPGSPGADDNGSGVAGILEASRAAALHLDLPLRFCFFGQEELSLLGSFAHMHVLGSSGRGKPAYSIIFEMIGYTKRDAGSQGTPLRIPILFNPPTTGDFIAAIADIRSSFLVRRFVAAASRSVPDLKVFPMGWQGSLLKETNRSDHLPYWRNGIPSMMLTDTANFRNPHYHRPSDLPDTLDYGFAANVVRATLAAIQG